MKDLEQECWDREPALSFALWLLKMNGCQQIWRDVENKLIANHKVTYGVGEADKSERASQAKASARQFTDLNLITATVNSRTERSGKSNSYTST